MDPWEREERMREASYSRVQPVRTWITHCPRCQRHVNPAMLQSPHWDRKSPPICSSCIRWEARWSAVENQRADDLQHRRKLK